ncbi:hypothetical protein OIV83_002008 [Microbotryomycetes sp. JL201]|nr:hypothetical protein OIV83_002008 [Microbotryomycetes sp. JL201]
MSSDSESAGSSSLEHDFGSETEATAEHPRIETFRGELKELVEVGRQAFDEGHYFNDDLFDRLESRLEPWFKRSAHHPVTGLRRATEDLRKLLSNEYALEFDDKAGIANVVHKNALHPHQHLQGLAAVEVYERHVIAKLRGLVLEIDAAVAVERRTALRKYHVALYTAERVVVDTCFTLGIERDHVAEYALKLLQVTAVDEAFTKELVTVTKSITGQRDKIVKVLHHVRSSGINTRTLQDNTLALHAPPEPPSLPTSVTEAASGIFKTKVLKIIQQLGNVFTFLTESHGMSSGQIKEQRTKLEKYQQVLVSQFEKEIGFGATAHGRADQRARLLRQWRAYVDHLRVEVNHILARTETRNRARNVFEVDYTHFCKVVTEDLAGSNDQLVLLARQLPYPIDARHDLVDLQTSLKNFAIEHSAADKVLDQLFQCVTLFEVLDIYFCRILAIDEVDRSRRFRRAFDLAHMACQFASGAATGSDATWDGLEEDSSKVLHSMLQGSSRSSSRHEERLKNLRRFVTVLELDSELLLDAKALADMLPHDMPGFHSLHDKFTCELGPFPGTSLTELLFSMQSARREQLGNSPSDLSDLHYPPAFFAQLESLKRVHKLPLFLLPSHFVHVPLNVLGKVSATLGIAHPLHGFTDDSMTSIQKAVIGQFKNIDTIWRTQSAEVAGQETAKIVQEIRARLTATAMALRKEAAEDYMQMQVNVSAAFVRPFLPGPLQGFCLRFLGDHSIDAHAEYKETTSVEFKAYHAMMLHQAAHLVRLLSPFAIKHEQTTAKQLGHQGAGHVKNLLTTRQRRRYHID